MQDLLSLLRLLACPVGMGLMMWFIMRAGKQQTPPDAVSQQEGRQRTVAPEEAQQVSMPLSEPSPLKAIWDCVQMCLNWKVLAVLAVVAVVVGVVAPQLFWGAIPTLLVLVCPLSMIVMMFSMSRKRGSAGSGASSCCEHEPTPTELSQIEGQKDSRAFSSRSRNGRQ